MPELICKLKIKFGVNYYSKERAPGERPYTVIKNIFKSGHTMVTTIARAAVKRVFASFGFNLFRLLVLKKQGIV